MIYNRTQLFPVVLYLSLFAPTIQLLIRTHAVSLSQFASLVDKAVLLFMLLYIFIKIIVTKKIYKPHLYLMSFLSYAFLLLLARNIPLSHILQIILDSRLFIYGVFFFLAIKNNTLAVKQLNTVIKVAVLLSVLISIVQIMSPDLYYNFFGIVRQDRGIWGINLSSFFYSRVAFAQFLVISLLYLIYQSKSIKKDFFWKFIILMMLVLTFSRKEIAFTFIVFPFVFLFLSNKVSAVKFVFLFIITCILSVVFFDLAWEYTERELTSDYIRFEIFHYASLIFIDHFPFGSGPGTFGSIFSLEYSKLYTEYNVPDRILYGYTDFGRGPIFDMFLSSLTAEYGLAIFLFILYIFSFLPSKRSEPEKWIYIFSVSSFLIYCSIMTPAFNTFTAVICMAVIKTIKFHKNSQDVFS